MDSDQVVFEDGWLQRQIEAAQREYDSWPKHKKQVLGLEKNKDNDD